MPPAEEVPVIYENDPLVNEWILNYNDVAEVDILEGDVKKGNISEKAIISIDGLYIELINAQSGIESVSVTGSANSETQLYPVFKNFVLSMDKNLTESEIETAWSDIVSGYHEIDYNNTGNANTYEISGIQMMHRASDTKSSFDLWFPQNA